MKTRDLVRYLDKRLEIGAVEDSSNNGLQVQGPEEVKRVAVATDAAMAVYQGAAEAGCELLIVHHGLIWRGIERVTGREYEHIKFLLDHGIGLYAAHLPLDLHGELGNNAELARMAGLEAREPFGAYKGTTIGFQGRLPKPMSRESLARTWQEQLGGESLILPFGPDPVRTVGIVSGGGSSALPDAIAAGLDCFVTGEGAHQDHHLAMEAGIGVIYLGHYHSETPGVRAVAGDIAAHFNIETCFIDVPTLL